MKKLLFVFVLVFAGGPGRAQHLDSLLTVAYAADQAARNELIRLYSQQPVPVDSLLAAGARLKQVDAECRHLVFGLLDGPGWPKGLSEEANHAICTVLDHAEPGDLKCYMPLVERQAEAGVVAR